MGKVILILADGMRSDAFTGCKNAYADELIRQSTHCINATTVMPSVTLPCHFSLFLSVPTDRHGILTNTYVPQVRPVDGLFEQIKSAGKTSAMFYSWEQLRDLSRPGCLSYSEYYNHYVYGYTNEYLTDRAIAHIKERETDFVFLYLGDTDTAGHNAGWMSDEYMRVASGALDCIKRVLEEFGNDYSVIVTADHGGHGRGHGSDAEEDMTIPMLFIGDKFEKNKSVDGLNIKDIAPTIADLMGVIPSPDWEGKSLIKK